MAVIETEGAVEDGAEEDDSESGQAVCKKPACKKPAACIAKPAAAIVVDDKSKPKLNTSTPTTYGGGRIYFSEKKYCFRVYKRTGDKVETSVKVWSSSLSDKKAAWKKALRAIDNDPRPR